MKEDKPMAKAYRIPDYRKMYPDAGGEVISLLKTTERKMQYQEYDLKMEQTIVSQEDQTITTIPSREDSLERLADQEVQFAGETESVEETVLRKIQYAQLHKALSLLSDDERELIDRLFFLTWGMTVQAFFALVHFHSPLYYLTFRDGI